MVISWPMIVIPLARLPELSLVVRNVFKVAKSVVLSATIVSSPDPGILENELAAINCAVVMVIPDAVTITKPSGKVAFVVSKWPLTTSKVPIDFEITLEEDRTTVSSLPTFFAVVSNSNTSEPFPDKPVVSIVMSLVFNDEELASFILTVISSAPSMLPFNLITVAFCALTSNKFCEELPLNEISNLVDVGTSKSTALKSVTLVSDLTLPRENVAEPSAFTLTEISPCCSPANLTWPPETVAVNCSIDLPVESLIATFFPVTVDNFGARFVKAVFNSAIFVLFKDETSPTLTASVGTSSEELI